MTVEIDTEGWERVLFAQDIQIGDVWRSGGTDLGTWTVLDACSPQAGRVGVLWQSNTGPEQHSYGTYDKIVNVYRPSVVPPSESEITETRLWLEQAMNDQS